MLTKMHENGGNLDPTWKIMLNRYIRLAPLNIFCLIFFWWFMPFIGGDGPAFFMYNDFNECRKYWISNVLFLNNLIPWS